MHRARQNYLIDGASVSRSVLCQDERFQGSGGHVVQVRNASCEEVTFALLRLFATRQRDICPHFATMQEPSAIIDMQTLSMVFSIYAFTRERDTFDQSRRRLICEQKDSPRATSSSLK